MSIEGPRSGAIGENWAAGFLGRFFLDISKPQTGPIDLCSHTGLRKHPGLCSEPYLSVSVPFHFQVKHGRTISQFQVTRSTFDDWLNRSENEPVIILHVTEESSTRPEFSFLVFHDWLYQDRATLALVSREHLPIDFFPQDFSRVEDDSENFWRALTAEADRAGRSASHPLTTTVHNRLYPANEASLLLNLEVLPHLEVSARIASRVYREFQMLSDTYLPALVRRALDGELSLESVLDEWWPRIRNFLAIGPSPDSFERRQFRCFIDALAAFGGGRPFRLPPHKTGELGCWRLFVSQYPYSINLLEHVLRNATRLDSRGDDIIFALALLPLLALNGDAIIHMRVMDLLSELDEHVRYNGSDNYLSYRLVREYYRTRLEAGDYKCVERANDVLFRGTKNGWEERHMREYGWWPNDESLLANLSRKIKRPTLRDENTLQFHYTMQECLVPIVKDRNPLS